MSAHEQSCEYAGRDDLAQRYLADRLPEPEAEAFEAHYFDCDGCWQRLRRALELRAAFADKAGAQVPAGDIAAARLPRTRNWWPIAAGVAVAALLLGTWRMTSHDGARFDPAMRGPGDSWQVSSHADHDALSASWPPVPDADIYRVRLFAADGTLLLERRTRENELEIRSASLTQLEPGQPVYWSVEALDDLRRSIARSDLVEAIPPEAP